MRKLKRLCGFYRIKYTCCYCFSWAESDANRARSQRIGLSSHTHTRVFYTQREIRQKTVVVQMKFYFRTIYNRLRNNLCTGKLLVYVFVKEKNKECWRNGRLKLFLNENIERGKHYARWCVWCISSHQFKICIICLYAYAFVALYSFTEL